MRSGCIAVHTALLAALGGCASMGAQDTLEKLREAVEGYNQAFRWKNYERAAQYLPNEVRAAFLAAYDDDESSLQLEDYQISKVDIANDDAATVSVRVRFLLLPSVVVENRTLVQHWHRVSGEWMLENEDNSIRKLDLSKTADLPPEKPDSPDAYEVETERDGPAGAAPADPSEPAWGE